MSHIDELIQRLCPDGVEFKRLGDVLKIKNGKDHKSLGDGDIPVYGSGGIMRYVDTAAAEGPSVLIPRKGSLGNIFYAEGPFWVVDTIFRTEIDRSQVEPKFVYHQLLTMKLGGMNQAGGVPSQTQSVLNKLRFPVPPLEVQREIVRILDQFTQLEAELEAELEARRRQYEHYQHEVFDQLDGAGVRSVSVKDLGRWYGGGTPSKDHSDYWVDGTIPWISPKDMGGSVVTDTQDHITEAAVRNSATKLVPANAVALVARSSILDHTLPVAFVPSPSALNQDMKAVIAADGIEPRYVFHVLCANRARMLRTVRRSGGSVASLDSQKLWKFEVPVPGAEEQRRITDFMDRFDALVNDISFGLPAELAARQKQYEYYRDKLLTFKEAT
jgi:type I restriction enzyme S subunit